MDGRMLMACNLWGTVGIVREGAEELRREGKAARECGGE